MPGHGVRGIVDGKRVAVGKASWAPRAPERAMGPLDPTASGARQPAHGLRPGRRRARGRIAVRGSDPRRRGADDPAAPRLGHPPDRDGDRRSRGDRAGGRRGRRCRRGARRAHAGREGRGGPARTPIRPDDHGRRRHQRRARARARRCRGRDRRARGHRVVGSRRRRADRRPARSARRGARHRPPLAAHRGRERARRDRVFRWSRCAVAALGYLPPAAGAVLQEIIDVAVILNALRALRDTEAAEPPAVERTPRSRGASAPSTRSCAPTSLAFARWPTRSIRPRPAESLAMAREIHRFLVEELGPHEEAEDATLYPGARSRARRQRSDRHDEPRPRRDRAPHTASRARARRHRSRRDPTTTTSWSSGACSTASTPSCSSTSRRRTRATSRSSTTSRVCDLGPYLRGRPALPLRGTFSMMDETTKGGRHGAHEEACAGSRIGRRSHRALSPRRRPRAPRGRPRAGWPIASPETCGYAVASAPGILYRLAGRKPDPDVADDVLADRIRSSLGPLEKRLDVPRVHVMVEDHVALLHGDVPDVCDAAAIEHAVMRVSGVDGVESHLHAGLLVGDTRPSEGAAVPPRSTRCAPYWTRHGKPAPVSVLTRRCTRCSVRSWIECPKTKARTCSHTSRSTFARWPGQSAGMVTGRRASRPCRSSSRR